MPATEASPKPELSRQQYLDLYYYMRLNREVEDTMTRLFRQNKIVGGLYSSLGQEAISVGSAYALEKKDWMAPMIRNIGALLVKGVPPRDIFTQHMAKYTSPTKGKDGTSHFGDLENLHIVSPISMLGDLIPVLTGVAMAGRYLGQKIVAMTWIGDGGSSTGVFHEGLNLAASQKAAFVLILENNQWAYSTPVGRQVPLEDLADRAKAYGISSYIVDGNDPVAVYSTAKEAVERARTGEGPILIEAKTFRRRGHAQHDPAEYVPVEQREYWEKRDPITLYEKFLTAEKILDAKGKKAIEDKINALLEKDREFAENSPLPPPELASEGVYCTGDDCHKICPKWERPISEVTPPKSSVEPVWIVEGFGRGKTSSRENAPIHFGDTQPVAEEPTAKTKSLAKPAAKSPARKPAPAKSPARGKARR
ncbi:MAG TPA: thiamine pyrophosphate-dependent dehydrogenase E1 component subunit alpha [Candidatus Acidoferrum sp.]|jgi:pyruvate dehydrogenase E1 component alpha subunit/2-oxoisovalerate dehydrogenase E1 component alpha subunit|nr:thiamine pyrophosphate-dependent dehydrogenase E1 component subunit alpha [Candidatus Acidoferrum sp.]